MSDFKAKMYQIQFRLGLCPRPRWGAYSAPPDPLVGLRGPTSKGKGGGRVWEGRGNGRGRGGGREGDETPSRPLIHISGYTPARDLLIASSSEVRCTNTR